MAHAAAHLKKARELEQHPEYRALQKARERRRRQRERAKRQLVKFDLSTVFGPILYHSIVGLGVPGEHRRPCGLRPDSNPAVAHPTLDTLSKGERGDVEEE
ncbi:ankyrin-2 isoform X4 [Lates japonicus]|uniref:Ankyrin-2 isoform X4 n=1 Tax=Lates japonicus TaxID=270547 RepID=A0AAD3RLY0_LATJO|nr:ankyrin-2 isoform X4 [Lates japonicus]